MRITLIVALCLGGCSTTSSPLDIISPDQLTVGHGQGTYGFDGKMDARGDDSWPSTYDGESESTYMALTWDIPPFKDDDRLTREERHAIRSLNLNAATEAEPVPDTKLNLRDGMAPPPPWLPYAIGGGLLAFMLLVFLKSRNSNGWH